MAVIDDVADRSDAELLVASRAGDAPAYAELWNRHRPAATRLARALTARDHEDLVSEAFSRILVVLRNGGGPEFAFRPYLLTTIRRLVLDRAKSAQQREVLTGDETDLDLPLDGSLEDQHGEGVEAAIAWTAWRSLPEPTRALLWHSVIEEERPAEIARMLGVSANSVASRTKRARERLRQAYLSEHAAHSDDEECRRVRTRLGSYVRHGLGPRGNRQIRDHLHGCRECRAAYAEIHEVDRMVLGVVAAIVGGGTALYAASRVLAPTAAAAATLPAGAGAGAGDGAGAGARLTVGRVAHLLGSTGGRVVVGLTAVTTVSAATTTALAGQPHEAMVSAPPAVVQQTTRPIPRQSPTSSPSPRPTPAAAAPTHALLLPSRPSQSTPAPPSPSRVSSPTASARPTASPSPSTTPSQTASSATASPSVSPTPSPSATPTTPEPSPSTPTPEPTPTPTATPSQEPTPSPEPSDSPSPTPTVETTPTTEPTPTPSETKPVATTCRFSPDVDRPYRALLTVPDGFRIVSVVDRHDGRPYEHVHRPVQRFEHALMPTEVIIRVERVGDGSGDLSALFTTQSGEPVSGGGDCSLETGPR